jgi:HprK-related kinase A
MSASAPLRRIGSLEAADFYSRLSGQGLALRLGPFDVKIRARAASLEGVLQQLYADYPLVDEHGVFSFHVDLQERRQWFPQPARLVRFKVDGRTPHADLPAEQALPVLEWGINLVVALRYHCFLMLHAAVLERHGHALVLPAAPGSGKTTLCAALMHRGWRLLSDEFGMVRPGTTQFIPLPRLMPIKNDAIDVIARFAPGARWGPVIENTRKGTIRHLRPTTTSIERAHESVPLRWLVFPRWTRDAPLSLHSLPRAEAFMQVAANAFNYEMQGQPGFSTVRALIQSARCFTLEYGSLEEVVAALERLAEDDAR